MTASVPFRIDLSLTETIGRLTGMPFIRCFVSLTESPSVNRPNRYIPPTKYGDMAATDTAERDKNFNTQFRAERQSDVTVH